MSSQPAVHPLNGLKLETTKWDDVAVIKCFGSLTTHNSADFSGHAKGMIPNRKRIVLDLDGVDRMDSSGLGAIVGVYISARKVKCEVFLINYNKSIRHLLGLTNLLSVFEACGQVGKFP